MHSPLQSRQSVSSNNIIYTIYMGRGCSRHPRTHCISGWAYFFFVILLLGRPEAEIGPLSMSAAAAVALGWDQGCADARIQFFREARKDVPYLFKNLYKIIITEFEA